MSREFRAHRQGRSYAHHENSDSHELLRAAAFTLRLIGHKKGRIRKFILAHGWTQYRDFPLPRDKTFQQLWREKKDE